MAANKREQALSAVLNLKPGETIRLDNYNETITRSERPGYYVLKAGTAAAGELTWFDAIQYITRKKYRVVNSERSE